MASFRRLPLIADSQHYKIRGQTADRLVASAEPLAADPKFT